MFSDSTIQLPHSPSCWVTFLDRMPPNGSRFGNQIPRNRWPSLIFRQQPSSLQPNSFESAMDPAQARLISVSPTRQHESHSPAQTLLVRRGRSSTATATAATAHMPAATTTASAATHVPAPAATTRRMARRRRRTH